VQATNPAMPTTFLGKYWAYRLPMGQILGMEMPGRGSQTPSRWHHWNHFERRQLEHPCPAGAGPSLQCQTPGHPGWLTSAFSSRATPSRPASACPEPGVGMRNLRGPDAPFRRSYLNAPDPAGQGPYRAVFQAAITSRVWPSAAGAPSPNAA